jgi:hypothetical protein
MPGGTIGFSVEADRVAAAGAAGFGAGATAALAADGFASVVNVRI